MAGGAPGESCSRTQYHAHNARAGSTSTLAHSPGNGSARSSWIQLLPTAVTLHTSTAQPVWFSIRYQTEEDAVTALHFSRQMTGGNSWATEQWQALTLQRS
jgi:hypothetical protein